jgi:CDGSH-type Zn-finger protein
MSDRPRITPKEDGPYLVEGAEGVTRLRDGETLPLEGSAALCRCGGSQNKPFCDGTHARNGFSGAKDPDRIPDHRDSYTSADGRITIHDDRGLCAHAARCTDNLASVFRLGTEPWIDPDGAPAEQIAAVLEMCPSGALSYTLDGKEHRDRGGTPSIGYAPGGPYVVAGGADLVGVDMPEGSTADHFTLCRCGASQNKPFCSGKHWNVDFEEDAGR